MSLLTLLGMPRVPAAVRGANLLIAAPESLAAARPFLEALERRIGPCVPISTGAATSETVSLPAALRQQPNWLRRAGPQRLILLGDLPQGAALRAAVEAPCAWINAPAGTAPAAEGDLVTVADPRQADESGGVHLTGDPLLGLSALPQPGVAHALCERFREQHRTGRWIAYFAGTGAGEEPLAYGSFFKLARKKMGFLALAPREAERYEPVYRDALRYRLPTNRHNRLSTSYVPLKTRVYYIEDPQVLEQMYDCADVVVAGGTLSPEAGVTPDVLTPILHGRPVIVGAEAGRDPIAAAAVRDGAVVPAADEDALVEAAYRLLTDEAQRAAQTALASRWAEAQPGATERVLALLQQQA